MANRRDGFNCVLRTLEAHTLKMQANLLVMRFLRLCSFKRREFEIKTVEEGTIVSPAGWEVRVGQA